MDTYEQILRGKLTPEAMKLQTKYDNARIGVNLGWNIASKLATPDTEVAELTATARHLAIEIAKDLDNTQFILGGGNGDTAKSA